jgi:hypothetical protein
MAVDEAIEEAAQNPQKVQTDGMSVEQHPLPDQVEADRYLESKRAAEKDHAGIRFVKLEPPGAA